MAAKPHPLIVVMGVSGAGKSTIGAGLAASLAVPFVDADDLHPVANVEKMAAGIPLSDDDRWPWLDRVGAELSARAATGAVIACSALKRVYRDAIRVRAPTALFVLLSGTHELLAARMARRENHFMPPALLASQLETLEQLADGEHGMVVRVDRDPEHIVAAVLERLRG